MTGDPQSEIPSDAATGVNVVAVLLTVFAILVFFYLIHIVLLPFVLAGAVAFVLTPIVDWMAAKTKAPRVAIAITVFFTLLALAGLLGYFAIPSLIGETIQLLGNFQNVIQQPLEYLLGGSQVQFLGEPISASQIAQSAVTKLRNVLQEGSNITAMAALAFGGMFGFFLTLTLLAYFIAGGGEIATGLLCLFPPEWRPRASRVITQLRPILLRYFAGIAIVIIYASLAAYLGLGVFLQLKHAAFLAFLTGLLEVLPVVGPAASAVIAGVAAIHEAKSIWSVVAYVIYAIALRLSIDQLVGPLVLGKAGRVHPALVIFCFLAGGVLFGISGVILAVPAALTVKVVLATIYGDGVEQAENAAQPSQ
jgi:predicted PurR-regulated permease PerM